MKRFPNGVDGGLLPPEACPRKPSRLCRRGARQLPERPLDGLRDRRQRGRARLGREPRLHRAAHLAFARARDRAPGLPPDRPRPDDRRPVAVRARDRARRTRGARRARPALVSEDVGRDRPAHPGADPPRAAVPARCGGSRKHWPRRSSGGSATSGSRPRRGASPTASASSSTSARTRATGRSRPPTRSAPLPDARVSAPLRWDEVAAVEPEAFTLRTMAERIRAAGDPIQGMWRSPPSLRAAVRAAWARSRTRIRKRPNVAHRAHRRLTRAVRARRCAARPGRAASLAALVAAGAAQPLASSATGSRTTPGSSTAPARSPHASTSSIGSARRSCA